MKPFNESDFKNKMPSMFSDVLDVIFSLGFTPTVIGGLPRDYLLSGKVGKDWDMEITHPTIVFDRHSWKELGKKLTNLGKTTYLPFEIIRLEIKDYDFEFSPPRREIFQSDWKDHGHKNFTAEFDYKMSELEARSRRDFTINTIGFRFHRDGEISVSDPLEGMNHLREKKLHPAGENFAKDPVRFLRAHRFKTKLGFSFSSELSKVLSSMPFEQLSSHYVWEEMLKSLNPSGFYQSVLNSDADIHLPLKNLNIDWQTLSSSDLKTHEQWVLHLELMGIPSDEWQKFFNVGSESLRKLGQWARGSNIFLQIKPEEFHGEFDDVRNLPRFSQLYEWYFKTKQLLQKNPSLPLMKLIEEKLPHWIHLFRFEPVKDLGHIDPPLRSNYQLWNLCQRL